MSLPKRAPESTYEEGAPAARRFQNNLSKILRVTKDELAKREASYQKARSKHPHRGPAKQSQG